MPNTNYRRFPASKHANWEIFHVKWFNNYIAIAIHRSRNRRNAMSNIVSLLYRWPRLDWLRVTLYMERILFYSFVHIISFSSYSVLARVPCRWTCLSTICICFQTHICFCSGCLFFCVSPLKLSLCCYYRQLIAIVTWCGVFMPTRSWAVW